MGKGLASAHTGLSTTDGNGVTTVGDVSPMDVTHAKVAATLTNYVAPEYTDIFDAAEVNFDERTELAQTIAGALGRQLDQLILDALDTATPGATIAKDYEIANTNTNMTLAKITGASAELSDSGVPMEGRVMVVSPAAIQSMMNDSTITSSDYNALRVLMSGEINTFMGFEWKMIETRTEGGLVVAANIRDCYAYHKSAVGLAIGIDLSTEVNYVPEKVSWLSLGKMKAGAVAVDTAGIVLIEIDETA
jgi:hypothetical protein